MGTFEAANRISTTLATLYLQRGSGSEAIFSGQNPIAHRAAPPVEDAGRQYGAPRRRRRLPATPPRPGPAVAGAPATRIGRPRCPSQPPLPGSLASSEWAAGRAAGAAPRPRAPCARRDRPSVARRRAGSTHGGECRAGRSAAPVAPAADGMPAAARRRPRAARAAPPSPRSWQPGPPRARAGRPRRAAPFGLAWRSGSVPAPLTPAVRAPRTGRAPPSAPAATGHGPRRTL
jgi:hypothetical protein